MVELLIANNEKEFEAASTLFREYAAWLNIDLGFQNFEKELEALKQMYNPADGGIILVKLNEEFIGCVAIRRISETVAELKRMYVKPAHQQKGVGQILLDKALKLATDLGYKAVRLDTLNHMLPAMSLYLKNGFAEIPAYYHNPNHSAVYFEKSLK